MLQTNYRASDAIPASKMELLNEYWSNESAPNETFAHPIECDPKENPFKVQYIRSAAVPTGDSILLYDLGNTVVATQGMPANGNPVGDLWVSYEIEFRKPMLVSNATNPVQAALGSGQADLFDNLLTKLNWSSDYGIDMSASSGTVLRFPAGCLGRYFVTITFHNNLGIIGNYPIVTYFNCTVTGVFQTTTSAGTSNLDLMWTFHVIIPNQTLAASVTLPNPGWGATTPYVTIARIKATAN